MVTDETAPWVDIYARLNERADAENPPSWQPERDGDELFGQLVAVNESAPTKYGSAPVVTIRKPDGEMVSLWLLHAVLRREFERAMPRLEEYVLVRYQGRVEPDGEGRPYENYAVHLDRGGQGPDWDRIAARYGDDLDARIDEPPTSNAALAGETPVPPDDDIPF